MQSTNKWIILAFPFWISIASSFSKFQRILLSVKNIVASFFLFVSFFEEIKSFVIRLVCFYSKYDAFCTSVSEICCSYHCKHILFLYFPTDLIYSSEGKIVLLLFKTICRSKQINTWRNSWLKICWVVTLSVMKFWNFGSLFFLLVFDLVFLWCHLVVISRILD